MTAEAIGDRVGDGTESQDKWSYRGPADRPRALKHLEFVVRQMQTNGDVPEEWLVQATRAYDFLRATTASDSNEEVQRRAGAAYMQDIKAWVKDRATVSPATRARIGRTVVTVGVGFGIAAGLAPQANAEPIRDTGTSSTAVSDSDRAAGATMLANVQAQITQLEQEGLSASDGRMKALLASRDSLLRNLQSDTDNNPKPWQVSIPGTETTTTPTEQTPTTEPSDQDNAPNPDQIVTTPAGRNSSAVADLLDRDLADLAARSLPKDMTRPSQADVPKYRRSPIADPYAALTQTNPDSQPAQSQERQSPDGSAIFVIDPNTPPANTETTTPSINTTTPTTDTELVGVNQLGKTMNETVDGLGEAIKKGDQGRFTELANESVKKLGGVGSLLSIAEALDQMEHAEKPTMPGGVTPSPRISKKALKQIREHGGNKAEQEARILMLNFGIKYADAHDSPVARYKPVAADPDYKQALKKHGINPTQKGFGSWVNDCMRLIKTVLQDSHVDKRFALNGNNEHMNTTAVYNMLVQKGKAGARSKVSYDIFKLSKVGVSNLVPGDIIIRPGHISMWAGGVKGEGGKLFDIIEAARGSERVPSFVTGEYLDYMLASDMTLVVRINLPDNGKATDHYNKPAKTEKSKKSRVRPLLDVIAKGESAGSYNAYFGNVNNKTVKLTEMTIDEVRAWQDQYVAKGSPSSAAGRYQFIRGTLVNLAKSMGMDTSKVKFSPETQDKLAIKLLERRGLKDYLSGKIDAKQFAYNLSQEWAALPKTKGKNADASYYAGDGLNAAHIKVSAVLGALEAIK